MELYNGRPESNEGRLEKEIKVYDFLDEIGVPFVRVDHEVVMTIEACKGIDETLGITINKNLFLCNRQETEFFLLLMIEDKPFKTKDVSKTIGKARLSFGKDEKLFEYLQCRGGSISPMGLLFDKDNDVNLIIDEELLKFPEFCVHPCDNSGSLAIKTEDFLKVFLRKTGHIPNIIHIDYPEM